ncbi:restriction endonuclease subunit S [Aeromonas caviae]|uniref:restriction endonuclease subunit S n=1 Tax=Aeromonas caviae TaxID=648 RepID=UPI001EED7D90|nr:restriction endonuclease subunit S [Aeromonas caviae]WKS84989.1 restriction endonuclease subunit S [Aeromonas caviae]BDC84696.1 hypothetical protein NUITMVA2_00530 [Aeromonas caviae]
MLPNGWELRVVGDLFEVQLGKMLNNAAKEKSPQYPYLGNSNVRWGCFDLTDLKTMHFSDRDIEKFELRNGDVIMCEGGEVGRCAIWNGEAQEIYYQKALHRLRSKGEIKPEYFQSYMEFINGSKLLDDFTTRTSIAHLTREKLLELPVKVPPAGEQGKIAKILSTWDKFIATTEFLSANSQQQKKALTQQLLTGKKRFTGFENKWKEVALSDLCQRVITRNNGQSTNVVTISAQHGLIRQEEFFNKSVASATLDNYYLLKKGQFAYNKSYSNGYPMGAIKRLNRYENGVVTSLYICFEVLEDADIDVDFLEHFFDSGLLNRGLTRVAAEGGRAHGLLNVKPADFMSLKLTVPGMDEQRAIARALTVAQSEVDNLEQKLAHLKQEKQALMKQLLTGKRRVKVDDKEVA